MFVVARRALVSLQDVVQRVMVMSKAGLSGWDFEMPKGVRSTMYDSCLPRLLTQHGAVAATPAQKKNGVDRRLSLLASLLGWDGAPSRRSTGGKLGKLVFTRLLFAAPTLHRLAGGASPQQVNGVHATLHGRRWRRWEASTHGDSYGGGSRFSSVLETAWNAELSCEGGVTLETRVEGRGGGRRERRRRRSRRPGF